MAQVQRRDKGSLLQMVYAKIEKEFGLDKAFSHWDFEDCIGADKSKDRNRISVRLVFLMQHGVLERVHVNTPTTKKRKYGVYKVVSFPLSVIKAVEKQDSFGLVPNTDLDNIFFNLGKKRHEKVNLQLLGRVDGRPKKPHLGGKAPTSTNANVHRARPDREGRQPNG